MGRPNKDDDAWNADISKVQVTPLLRNEVSQANGDRIAALAGNARYAGKTWTTGRKLLFACLALACLISVAAVVVSAVAFANTTSSGTATDNEQAVQQQQQQQHDEQDASAVEFVVPGGNIAGVKATQKIGKVNVPPKIRVVLDDEKLVPAHGQQLADSLRVGVHGNPSVILENLCNVNFGNGTCLSVFSYQTGPFGADADDDDELFVQAGSPKNFVQIFGGNKQNSVQSGDVGQPQVFTQNEKFGGASFSWPCGRGAVLASQETRAVWSLHTQGGSSVVQVTSDNVPCPALPV